MSNHDDEDDKPTVVLDLNALKAQAKQEQEQLDELASDLEFNAAEQLPDAEKDSPEEDQDSEQPDATVSLNLDLESEEDSLELSSQLTPVVLFDYNSEFFSKNKNKFPEGYDYRVLKDLKSLNKELQTPGLKAVVFNYNASPKAANQLCAQIKSKFPQTKTLIMAKNLSKEKAQAHKKTKSGANGYVSAPFKIQDFKEELAKILEE